MQRNLQRRKGWRNTEWNMETERRIHAKERKGGVKADRHSSPARP